MYESPSIVCPSGSACDLRVWLLRRSRRQQDSLYTHAHVRDAFNTFLVLVILGSDSTDLFCLNHMGSNPLEHKFGRARMRCWDVMTTEKLITGFRGDFMSHPRETFLRLGATPHRRCPVGCDCLPLSPGEPSTFLFTPYTIALPFLARSARSQIPESQSERF
jgi:hypothetical protein